MKCCLKLCFGLLTVLAVISPAAVAQGGYGDWEWGYADDATYLWAGTVNDEGGMLGEFCYFDSQSCLYYFGQDVECVPEDTYPVLASSVYAFAVDISCSHEFEGIWVYIFSDWQEIESALLEGIQLGIAMALEDDSFHISSFSLRGSADTLEEMEAAFEDFDESGRLRRPTGTKSL